MSVREEEHVTGLSKAAATKKTTHTKECEFAGWVDDSYTSEGLVASLMKATEGMDKESRRAEMG